MLLIFRNPHFRLLWIAGAFNDMGLVMYFMVNGWLALTLTDSPFWVGATAGMSGLGLMSFSILGGVLADRANRRRLIVGAQLAEVAMGLALAALIFSGNVRMWQVLAVAFLFGAVAALKMPARMAMTLDVVGRERLLSATAASFATFTVMGIVSPLVGGAVVSALDIGWAYVIIGGSHLSAAGILVTLTYAPRASSRSSSPWEDLKVGIRYAFTTPTVRTLVLILLVTQAFGGTFETMMPVMARDVLGVGVAGLGYMLAAANGGGTVSTLIVSSVGEIRNKGRPMVVASAAFGLFVVLFAASTWVPLSMTLLALAGASIMVYEAMLNTLLQTAVPDEMRGRVLSFQAFSWGLIGVSGFHTGAIASLLSPQAAIAIGGGVVFLNALRMFPVASRLRDQPAEVATGD